METEQVKSALLAHCRGMIDEAELIRRIGKGNVELNLTRASQAYDTDGGAGVRAMEIKWEAPPEVLVEAMKKVKEEM